MIKYEPVLVHWGILGMKWGVRRYQNEDGTLTEAGKRRYAQEVQRNHAKPKDKRANSDSDLFDPEKWAKQDNENLRDTINSSKDLVDSINDLNKQKRSKRSNTQRLDLSNKSDKELREEINRELLERQYNDMFNAPETNRGREVANKILSGASAGLTLAAAAVSIAVGIQKLTGH